MPKIRSSIPLNDSVLSTLRVGVELNYEPLRVNAHRLPILLVYGNVRGSQADSSPDGVPPPAWRHRPTNRHCRRCEDQGSWWRPAPSLWSPHTEGGTCGSPNATGPQVLSTRWSLSSTDRRWVAEQAVGTPHVVWTAHTARPSSGGYACRSWAVANDVEHNNSTKILASCATT
jgi:hypothetical protein